MVNRTKKTKHIIQNHFHKAIIYFGFFWNAKVLLSLSIHRKLNSDIHIGQKNDGVETKRMLALALYLFCDSYILLSTFHPTSSLNIILVSFLKF